MYRIFSICFLLPDFCVDRLSGCEPAWRNQFPDGTKLYEQTGHKYFGKVVGLRSRARFPQRHPALGVRPILIEPAEEGQTPQWGSCATCAATFQTEAP